MSLLYSFLIEPLELFYRLLYLRALSLTQSHLFALLLMSITSGFVYVPFRRLAQRMQDDERKIEAILAPQIERIRNESQGRARHERISRLYGRYGWHPIYSVRSAFGILVQLPFITAAYRMLSQLAILKGQGVPFVADLSQPDRILAGLHLLPLLMTAINIGATLTTPRIGVKERRQAIVVAMVFLVALYRAPAALLIFWTSNNLISLLQNFLPGLARARSSAAIPVAATAATFPGRRSLKLAAKFGPVVYAQSLFILAVLVGVVWPLALCNSDRVFAFRARDLAHLSAVVMGSVFLASFLVWYFSPLRARNALAQGVLGLAAFACLVSTVLSLNYGSLDVTLLVKWGEIPVALKNRTDLIALLLAGTFVYVFYRDRRFRQLSSMLLVVSFSLVAASAYFATQLSLRKVGEGEIASQGPVFSFSKTGKNLLVFIPDAFTGSHLSLMLDKNDDFARMLREKYRGFTWYPDTLAAGTSTERGVPAILGGPGYIPAANEQLSVADRNQEFGKAITLLPRIFAGAGYEVRYLNFLPFRDYPAVWKEVQKASRELPNFKQLDYALPTVSRNQAYGTIPEFLLVLSLFRVVPHSLRAQLYRRGQWLPFISLYDPSWTERRLFPLQRMTDVASAAGPIPTLQVFYNDLTHAPWFLDRDSLEIVSEPYVYAPVTPMAHFTTAYDIFPAHLFSERHALRLFADFLDWMRKEGVYENTRIIIASDHGALDSQSLIRVWGKESLQARAGAFNSLLMVKDFGESGPLKVSPLFVSNADVPAFLCDGIPACRGAPGIPGTPPLPGGPARTLYSQSREAATVWKVSGSMFDPRSPWTQVQPPVTGLRQTP